MLNGEHFFKFYKFQKAYYNEKIYCYSEHFEVIYMFNNTFELI